MNAPQLPAFLQNRLSKRLAENLIGNLGAGSPAYVSIQGNRFTLIDSVGDEEAVATYDPKIGPYLDCVIIDANDHISKIYYGVAFDPNAASYGPPACFSDNGIAPSRNASEPQSPTCASCPKAIWGSATSKVSGKGIPACQTVQKLAIAIPGDDVVFLLRVPPNSLSNFREYDLKFRGQQTDISDVITRVSFELQGMGTLMFMAVNYIDETFFAFREAILQEKKTDALIGRLDQPIQGLLTAPAPSTVQSVAAIPQNPQPPMMESAVAAGARTANAMAAPVVAEAPTGRRKRRTQAEMAAAAGAPQGQAEMPLAQSGVASSAPQMAPFRPAEAPQTAGAQFGIGGGVAPNPELAAALGGLFGKS